eukprot:6162265-Alexandrium_andersonii.AAC.1
MNPARSPRGCARPGPTWSSAGAGRALLARAPHDCRLLERRVHQGLDGAARSPVRGWPHVPIRRGSTGGSGSACGRRA